MVKTFNSKRVLFPKGRQKEFIGKILTKISIENAAKLCRLSERTIRDWHREKFLPDFGSLRRLCKKANIIFPSWIELKDRYWYVEKGASMGGKTTWRKYGRVGSDSEYRKKKWREWWEREGKYKSSAFPNLPKPIKKPFFSKELAEFVGIMLGDGGISKYQVTITSCSKDEEIYSNFIARLAKKLFNVPVAVLRREENSTIGLVISRVGLVRFFSEKLGLHQGNKIKQQVDIPGWIKNNKSYSVACARGLIDTDGSVFRHSYKVNGKLYSYKKIGFTSRSKPLRKSVCGILKEAGIKARFSGHYDARVDSKNDVKKYFKIFNSHNHKHLIRYKK